MERLTTSKYGQYPGSWSSDGKTVAFVEIHPDTGSDIAMLDVRSGRVTPFLNSRFNEQYPEFSPDGRWMAYSSDESKRYEAYVQPFPGPGMKYPISSEAGHSPLWSKDGKRLFYRWQDQVWAVDVRTDGGSAAGKPRLLFERPGYYSSGPIRSYDLSLCSKRFLMMKLDQRKPTPVTEMILVQNWFEELRRLVPTGKK
jgi:Tol biopolymer transport system component